MTDKTRRETEKEKEVEKDKQFNERSKALRMYFWTTILGSAITVPNIHTVTLGFRRIDPVGIPSTLTGDAVQG